MGKIRQAGMEVGEGSADLNDTGKFGGGHGKEAGLDDGATNIKKVIKEGLVRSSQVIYFSGHGVVGRSSAP